MSASGSSISVDDKEDDGSNHKQAVVEFEATLGIFPDDLKEEYVEARSLAPSVVDSESNALLFLRREGHKALPAVLRFVLYWKQRKKLFGRRFSNRMDVSPNGIFENDENDLFSAGYAALLPIPDRDNSPVILCDFERLYSQVVGMPTLEERTRHMFFLAHYAAERPGAQEQGITFVFVTGTISLGKQRVICKEIMVVIKKSLPVKVKKIFIISSTKAQSDCNTLISDLTPLGDELVPIVGDAQIAILSKLISNGLVTKALPQRLGGEWRWDQFSHWLISKGHAHDGQPLVRPARRVQPPKLPEVAYRIDERAGLKSVDPVQDSIDDDDKPPIIFNGLDGFIETPDIIQKGLVEMEEAISMLSFKDKEALFEARKQDPALVEKETPCLRFLRFENYNTWAAAKRFANYWNLRRDLFGKRRYILPMNLSGEGTLTRDDVSAFSSGYLAPLPYDQSGRSVIVINASKITDQSLIVRSRLVFYLWSVVAENPRSQQDGIKVIVVKRTVFSLKSQLNNDKFHNALPLRYQSVIIANHPDDYAEKSIVLNSIVPAFLKLLGTLARRSAVMVANTREELGTKLVQHGLLPDGIPECLGGTWTYEMFSRWVELRTRYEWNLPVSGGKLPNTPHVPHYEPKPKSHLAVDERAERDRRLNVLNSRRKRERVKVEEDVLTERVEKMLKVNKELKDEGERLESCIASAHKLIGNMTKSSAGKEREMSNVAVRGSCQNRSEANTSTTFSNVNQQTPAPAPAPASSTPAPTVPQNAQPIQSQFQNNATQQLLQAFLQRNHTDHAVFQQSQPSRAAPIPPQQTHVHTNNDYAQMAMQQILNASVANTYLNNAGGGITSQSRVQGMSPQQLQAYIDLLQRFTRSSMEMKPSAESRGPR